MIGNVVNACPIVHDPWRLDEAGDGSTLADGASFLLPCYLGLYHGFIIEDSNGK